MVEVGDAGCLRPRSGLQLSVPRRLRFDSALRARAALAPLRRERVLTLESGFSYHNLRWSGRSGSEDSKAVDSWLAHVLTRTTDWTGAPAARRAHPREDHLIPLMVAVGAAQEELDSRVYHENSFLGALAVSSYRFGSKGGN